MGQWLSISERKHVPLSKSRESLNFEEHFCRYCDQVLTDQSVCGVCHAYRSAVLDYVRAFGCPWWEEVHYWKKDLTAPDTHSCSPASPAGGLAPNWRTLPEDCDEIYTSMHRLVTPTVIQDDLSNPLVFPPEILSMIFKSLDEVSLINASRVCSYWNSVVLVQFPEFFWESLFRQRWPLFRLSQPVESWLRLYAELGDSVCCKTCLLNATGQVPVLNFCGYPGTLRESRLEAELLSLQRISIGGIEVAPVDYAKYNWIARIEGPHNSPYAGGVFYINLKFPQNYPFQSPTCRFVTKILHPNVSRHGDVLLQVLDPRTWNPGRTLTTVIKAIIKAMIYPEMMKENKSFFASTMRNKFSSYVFPVDKAQFSRLAKYWTKRYATNPYELADSTEVVI